MNLSLKNLLILGVLAEISIFFISYALNPTMGETFRHAARYSGRLSALVFLLTFYLYATSSPKPVRENTPLRNFLTLFAVLHVIHFGFLATNVYLNAIPLEPPKLAGGMLAYLMIVIAPFQLHKVKFPVQMVYFYYVSLVMVITYIARIKGDFVGAEPYWLHYAIMGTLILAALVFGAMIFRSRRQVQVPS